MPKFKIDEKVIDTVKGIGTKLWLMSLNGEGEYCNPSVENLAREVFLAQQILFEQYPMLRVWHLRIYETPNCWTDCYGESICPKEKDNFYEQHYEDIGAYAADKGVLEYGDRKSTAH